MPQPIANSRLLSSTLTPFLYPCLHSAWPSCTASAGGQKHLRRRWQTTAAHHVEDATEPSSSPPPIDVNQYDHLNPQPLEYSDTPFTDACTLTIQAGNGGHGCISFLREKFIANGPANGGDGGTGGSIYIQAVRGETSLHKLARRGILKAARGRNGQGSSRGGKRGDDVLLSVPVGTVIREIRRHDPLEIEERERTRAIRAYGADANESQDADAVDNSPKWRRDKWLLYPGALPSNFTSADFPPLPRPRKSNLTLSQPSAPLRLDLSQPMNTPLLLAAGAMGGLGNPHFVTKSIPRPKFATKGDDGMRIQLQLELKLLADVGLVGLPNAGKSTLLRALTNSRARVGDWAFTTLSPNIGTVVLDNQRGRVGERAPTYANGEPRTHFTIADNPGLIEDAHLDRGLGLGFLRHIERAGVLAFVIDLSAGSAVEALKALWKEVVEYEDARDREVNEESERSVPDEQGLVGYQPLAYTSSGLDAGPAGEGDEDLMLDPQAGRSLPRLALPPITAKPWLVVATKADKPDTQENFFALREYLGRVQGGNEVHPSGKKNAWTRDLQAVPVCAMQKENADGVRALMVKLLGESPAP